MNTISHLSKTHRNSLFSERKIELSGMIGIKDLCHNWCTLFIGTKISVYVGTSSSFCLKGVETGQQQKLERDKNRS
jgi:hypothetical protein